VWVLVRGLALWNERGEALRFVGTYMDMTAQKAAEEKLRDSEQYRRTLIEESLVGLVLADLDGHIQEVNPAYANIVGYMAAELCQYSLCHLVPYKYHALVKDKV
jgi:PAS domain-containing protein